MFSNTQRPDHVVRPARALLALALILGLAGLTIATTRAANTLAVCPSGCTYTSIQAAINAASAGDTIKIGMGTYNELLTIGKDLTLQGAGAAQVTIDGGGRGRVVTLPSVTTVTISGVTISGGYANQDGYASNGGGISNNGGTLMVINSTINGNNSAFGGGGIFNNGGTLMVTNSTFSGNNAPNANGGGIYNTGMLTVTNSTFSGNYGFGGGGISNRGTLTVTNSTFSGNNCDDGAGGGIENQGTLTVTNSTISGNFCVRGGGAISNDNAGNVKTMISNTIVANSPLGGNCNGTIGDSGSNLSSDTSCAFTAASSKNNIDPKLGPLQDNGGLTLTMALLPGSPAIDAGDNSQCPVTDQRGIKRPQGPACDIGAFELQQGFRIALPFVAVGRP